MADFCEFYSEHLFGTKQGSIDVKHIGKSLKKEHYQYPFICEGCGKSFAVIKDKDGKIGVIFEDEKEELNEIDMLSYAQFKDRCNDFINEKQQNNGEDIFRD